MSAFPEDLFRCPRTKAPLRREGDAYVGPAGERWPIVAGIPRFVDSENYAASFGYEWNLHNTTQLDCHNNDTKSEGFFEVKTGFTRETLDGKLILDAGTGAGRFADVVSRWGGRVVGVDLSRAVEAAYGNLHERPNVQIAQADITQLPFAPGTFDAIFSIGVLHHTPDTRRSFECLVPLLKPGGEIAIWVYPDAGDYALRAKWIPFTRHIPDEWFYDWCRAAVPVLRYFPDHPWTRLIARTFPFSQQDLGLENDILDTFDGFSPTYHGVHSPDEVVGWFEAAGLEQIEVLSFDTAVRGRRPRSEG